MAGYGHWLIQSSLVRHFAQRGVRPQDAMTPENVKLVLGAFEKKMEALFHLADKLAMLASGALALTVTFLNEPVSGCSVWFIRMSWIGFICTVLGFLMIHTAKISAYQDFMDSIKSGKGAPITVEPVLYFGVARWLIIGGFILGLVSLAVFGWLQT